MKIGLLTFHWGTNYGAILQAWCLQECLLEQGHEVEIINYKPSQYDFSWIKIIRHPGLLKKLSKILIEKKKESLLIPFRKKYLNLTRRYKSVSEFDYFDGKYDVLISGSDQVLNPSFTCRGENGKPSSVYWLGFGDKKAKRIGYAVSFGCENYPNNAISIAKQWVDGFSAIATRENTGLQILDQLSYEGPKLVVPDPTLLAGVRIFERLGITLPVKKEDYTCVYMLRHEIKINGNVRYIDETHKPLTMEQWLKTIIGAGRLVTNSYHGTLMAIFAHVPFSILLETGKGSGKNDRFYTLLDTLDCTDRVASTVNEALDKFNYPIDFCKLDEAVVRYRQIGIDFLKNNI